MTPPEMPPQAIVIFGASGDLARRKLLPALFHLFTDGLLPERFAIVGYARSPMTDDAYRDHAHDAVLRYCRGDPGADAWNAFSERLTYLPGGFTEPGAMQHLADHLRRIDAALGPHAAHVFFCATPPDAYPQIALRIGEAGLHDRAKIVFEKPFGQDVHSARTLDATVHEVFEEPQVFRIDHYLGKETVQNILAFRFANGLFEPVWNRRYIDHVQITVAEEIGIEGRAAFFEQTGVIRDVVATHLFQVMTFLAMEPPVSFEPDRLRDETVKVLRSMKPCNPRGVVRGQYAGYRSQPGVSPDSTVETFAALALEIDNWRWAGVPFFVRTGKRLATKVSEITLTFRNVPFDVFRGSEGEDMLPWRDHLTIRIQPDEGITLTVNAKVPGPGLRLGRVPLDFTYHDQFQARVGDAYELLLLQVMEGDQTLFLRQDGVERAWEVLDPVLAHPAPITTYQEEGWGPPEADALIAPRRWYVPGSRPGALSDVD